MAEEITSEEVTPEEVTPEEAKMLATAEEVDLIFDENGINIVDLVLQQDPQKIIMLVKSSLHPDCDPSKVTMHFDEDEKPTTMDFEGPDEFTEEEGKEVLNGVMNSLIELLAKQEIPDEPEQGQPEEPEEV